MMRSVCWLSVLHRLLSPLILMAGVSSGLATLGQRILSPAVGNQLLRIILSSSVLYEMIGPACAKFPVFHSGSVSDRKDKNG